MLQVSISKPSETENWNETVNGSNEAKGNKRERIPHSRPFLVYLMSWVFLGPKNKDRGMGKDFRTIYEILNLN